MALTDFLTNGQIPAGSAATSTTSQTILPDWYTNYAMQIVANQNAAAATPYQPYQGPRVAEFSPDTMASFGMTKNAAGAYQPGLAAATEATKNVMTGPGGAAAAQPYMSAAGNTSVANIGAYMNPYTENVVNRIADLGVRNLNENIMPGIEGRYIAAGQLGFGGRQPGSATPSGMMTDTARAVRDVSSDILGKQAEALQAGYGQALGASAADLERMGALATTAGGLANTDAARALSAAEQLGGLATAEQSLGLKGAEAVRGVGSAIEDKAQANIDVAYADHLRQLGYPQEQIDNMVKTLGAVKGAVPTATTEEGIVPLGYQPKYGASTAETIGSSLAVLGGILDKAGVF